MQEENWWPSLEEYDPGLSAENYHDMFLDTKVVPREWLGALYDMYRMPGHFGTCKQMGIQYGYHYNHYNSFLTTAAENIAKKTGCPMLPRELGDSRWWPVLFQGQTPNDK